MHACMNQNAQVQFINHIAARAPETVNRKINPVEADTLKFYDEQKHVTDVDSMAT